MKNFDTEKKVILNKKLANFAPFNYLHYISECRFVYCFMFSFVTSFVAFAQYPVPEGIKYTFSSADDSFVYNASPSTNFGNNAELVTKLVTPVSTKEINRSLIQFNINNAPSSSIVNKAYLSLVHPGNTPWQDVSSGDAYAYQITSSWSASNVNWTNQPSYTTSNAASIPSLGDDDPLFLDVTDIVKNWHSNNYSNNNGFLLKFADEVNLNNKIMRFQSANSTNTSKRPELIVYYIVYENRISNPNGSNLINNQNNKVVVYPNPINESFTTTFYLEQNELTSIEIIDVNGKKVKEVINNEMLSSGRKEINIDSQNLPSGVYYVRLLAGKSFQMAKLVKM